MFSYFIVNFISFKIRSLTAQDICLPSKKRFICLHQHLGTTSFATSFMLPTKNILKT
jgi:hypothetical protein